MKTLLFTICVLMSIHAAISINQPSFCDNFKTCLKNNSLNYDELQLFSFNFSMKLQPTFSANLNYLYQRLLNKLCIDKRFALVNSIICALKKDGVINQEGKILKNRLEQYCEENLTKLQNILECQRIATLCTNNFAYSGVECIAEEVCKLDNSFLSFLEC